MNQTNPQALIPNSQKDILVYQGDAGVKMTVKTDGETIWLTQEQMCQLFGRDQSVIARHIGNIFKEKELAKDSVYAKFAYTATDHKVYQVAYYNLDVVISVGYRVKSVEGTRFRQWATRVLREMLLNRLEEVKRIGSLERRSDAIENDIKHIKGGVNYLFKKVTSPDEPPRRRIGFGADENDMPSRPYAKIREFVGSNSKRDRHLHYMGNDAAFSVPDSVPSRIAEIAEAYLTLCKRGKESC